MDVIIDVGVGVIVIVGIIVPDSVVAVDGSSNYIIMRLRINQE